MFVRVQFVCNPCATETKNRVKQGKIRENDGKYRQTKTLEISTIWLNFKGCEFSIR